MRTKSQIYLILFVLVALISLIDFVVVLYHLTKMTNEKSAENEHPLICLACNQFPPGSEFTPLTSKMSRSYQDGVENCCVENYDQMSPLLELIRLKQKVKFEPVTYDPEQFTSHRVSAHKRLMQGQSDMIGSGWHSQFRNETNILLRLDNTNTDPMREHASNLEVLPSGYHVLVSGIYHIYSNIELNTNSHTPCREYDIKTWRQGVVRSRANHRQDSGVLLTSTHTCCDDCTWDKETSYAGGTFFLQAGDHLHVEVSSFEITNFESESSYFGLLLLADVSP